MAILGAILAVLAMLVTIGLQKAHHDQTGVWGPSRSQMRYIRRKARKEGLSEQAAYETWLSSKQKRLGVSSEPTLISLVAPQPKKRRGNIAGVLLAIAILVALALLARPRAPAGHTAIVDGSRVNCRADASIDARVVRQLSRNEPVQIVREQSGWSKVEGAACWIRSELLRAG